MLWAVKTLTPAHFQAISENYFRMGFDISDNWCKILMSDNNLTRTTTLFRGITMIEIADTTTGNVLQSMTVEKFLKNLASRWHTGSVQEAIAEFNDSMISVRAQLA